MEHEMEMGVVAASNARNDVVVTGDPPAVPAHDNEGLVPNGSADTQTREGVAVGATDAVAEVWSRPGIVVACVGIFLLAFTTSLEGQVTYSVMAFATSSFGEHSLIASIYVVQGVVSAVSKPPIAKMAAIFGRLSAFGLCIAMCVVGYAMMAASASARTFAAAQMYYAAGSAGLQVLQQVLVADTTDVLDRALFSSLPEVPFLVTTWVGPLVGGAIVASSTWRWAYGVWAIILPVVFLPLALTLFVAGRRGRKLVPRPLSNRNRNVTRRGPLAALTRAWHSLDAGGTILLMLALTAILVPLSLAKTSQGPELIALVVVGGVLLVAFPFWEASKKLAPSPLVPPALLKSRTFCVGCCIGFLYFLVFNLSVQPYFYSYLLVARRQSPAAAGHITQAFSLAAAVMAVLTAGAISGRSGRYKRYLIDGALLYLLGTGLPAIIRSYDGAPDASITELVLGRVVAGVGAGSLTVSAQQGVQAAVPREFVAPATAVFLMLVEIGGAVGAAVSGALWTRLVPAKLAAYLPAETHAHAIAIFADVAVAGNYTLYPPGSPAREAINRSYRETMQVLLTVAAIACVPLLPLSLFMKDCELEVEAGGGGGGGRKVEGVGEART